MSGWVNGDFFSELSRGLFSCHLHPQAPPQRKHPTHTPLITLLPRDKDLEGPWQRSPVTEGSGKGHVPAFSYGPQRLLAGNNFLSNINPSSSSYCSSPLECCQASHRAPWLRMEHLPGTVPLFPFLCHKGLGCMTLVGPVASKSL